MKKLSNASTQECDEQVKKRFAVSSQKQKEIRGKKKFSFQDNNFEFKMAQKKNLTENQDSIRAKCSESDSKKQFQDFCADLQVQSITFIDVPMEENTEANEQERFSINQCPFCQSKQYKGKILSTLSNLKESFSPLRSSIFLTLIQEKKKMQKFIFESVRKIVYTLEKKSISEKEALFQIIEKIQAEQTVSEKKIKELHEVNTRILSERKKLQKQIHELKRKSSRGTNVVTHVKDEEETNSHKMNPPPHLPHEEKEHKSAHLKKIEEIRHKIDGLLVKSGSIKTL